MYFTLNVFILSKCISTQCFVFFLRCTIGQLFWLYICYEASFLQDPTDNGKNKTHSQLNGAPTVCWTCCFFCLPTIPPTNGSSLLPWFESWQTNTCASVFTVVCPRLYCNTEEWGGWYYTMYCIPMCSKSGAEKESTHFYEKKKQQHRDRDAGCGVSHPRRTKKPHCGKSPDCEVLLINSLSKCMWLCVVYTSVWLAEREAKQWDEDSRWQVCISATSTKFTASEYLRMRPRDESGV